MQRERLPSAGRRGFLRASIGTALAWALPSGRSPAATSPATEFAERYKPIGGAEEERAHALFLVALAAVERVAGEILADHEDCRAEGGCTRCIDAEGIAYTVRYYRASIGGYALPAVLRLADRLLERPGPSSGFMSDAVLLPAIRFAPSAGMFPEQEEMTAEDCHHLCRFMAALTCSIHWARRIDHIHERCEGCGLCENSRLSSYTLRQYQSLCECELPGDVSRELHTLFRSSPGNWAIERTNVDQDTLASITLQCLLTE